MKENIDKIRITINDSTVTVYGTFYSEDGECVRRIRDNALVDTILEYIDENGSLDEQFINDEIFYRYQCDVIVESNNDIVEYTY